MLIFPSCLFFLLSPVDTFLFFFLCPFFSVLTLLHSLLFIHISFFFSSHVFCVGRKNLSDTDCFYCVLSLLSLSFVLETIRKMFMVVTVIIDIPFLFSFLLKNAFGHTVFWCIVPSLFFSSYSFTCVLVAREKCSRMFLILSLLSFHSLFLSPL